MGRLDRKSGWQEVNVGVMELAKIAFGEAAVREAAAIDQAE